jgi:hypothetical protein
VEQARDVSTEQAASDAELLAGLQRHRRMRGPGWQLVSVAVFLALGAGQIAAGNRWIGVAYLVIGVLHGWSWWTSPAPRLQAVTPDALLVRRGLRTQAIPRTDLVDVHPKHTGAYGLELSVRGGGRLRLAGTAPRFSVAEAQATALRRWAGMDR